MMSFKEAIKVCFKKYFKISGRATRAEYWWFQLFFNCFFLLPLFLGIDLLNGTNYETLGSVLIGFSYVILFISIIPLFCVKIRRYHDIGASGFTLFVYLIPAVGSLIDFILMLLKSTPDNEWGPNPFNEQKEITIESEIVAKQEENKNVIDVEL